MSNTETTQSASNTGTTQSAATDGPIIIKPGNGKCGASTCGCTGYTGTQGTGQSCSNCGHAWSIHAAT
ncbi:hypothetical protein BT96DRAFT_920415 [Gymnopus androsaceus JB14]|uniref:Uncharacterized protein n=1 Tax=Gymnopus androsaceus JB14 TaxID=1447944 RepID=A0A6A4HQL8_9AGAR|nr:hypothetical protein BT96DRAFT_920415 [Gymnopus androsaceus JB14]